MEFEIQSLVRHEQHDHQSSVRFRLPEVTEGNCKLGVPLGASICVVSGDDGSWQSVPAEDVDQKKWRSVGAHKSVRDLSSLSVA